LKRLPQSVEVIETAEGRFVVTTTADGETISRRVDPGQKPKRKPRKPIARATAVRRADKPPGG
jgi:hypothetical protein